MVNNWPIVLASAWCLLALTCQLGSTSPPVDYLLFNGESSNNVSNGERHLKQLKSIFGANQDSVNWQIARLLANASHQHDDSDVNTDMAIQAWQLMQKQATDYAEQKVAILRPLINELMSEANVTDTCQQAINGWLMHLSKFERWAVVMWNAWGQFPSSGLLEGSFTDLGSYRGCLSAGSNEIIGESQYCTLDLQPIVPKRPRFHNIFAKILQLNSSSHGVTTDDSSVSAFHELSQKAQFFYYVKFRLGSCFPTKCTTQDIQQLTTTGAKRAILQATNVECQKYEPVHLNTYQIVAVLILGSLALVAIAGTFVDLIGFQENSSNNAIIDNLLPFSVWTNSKRLFNTDSATVNELTCIQGLRFLSMIWVIYGHTILFTEYQSYTQFFESVENNLSSFFLLPTLNANFSVDTFFVISGILTSYVTYTLTQGDKRRFNKFAFAISRYIRLTPQLAIVILCFFLLPLLGDGPIFKHVMEDKAEKCYKNWWIDLLYVQSFFDKDMCIIPSWWLSIEMFFHVFSILVMTVMLNNAFQGMVLNFGLAAAMTLYGSYLHYTHGFAIQYLPAIPQRYEVDLEQTSIFFHRPWPHAPSFFIGLALGYLLANEPARKITRAQITQGWLCATLGLITIFWGPYYWNLGAPYTQWQSSIYYNTCQIIWPMSIAWIIYACATGRGGMLNEILSARVFVPFGRITYMTYLSHSLVVYHTSAIITIASEPSLLAFVYRFISNTVVSLILGTLLTVVYESPLLQLQKRLFNYLAHRFDPVPQTEQDRPATQAIV